MRYYVAPNPSIKPVRVVRYTPGVRRWKVFYSRLSRGSARNVRVSHRIHHRFQISGPAQNVSSEVVSSTVQHQIFRQSCRPTSLDPLPVHERRRIGPSAGLWQLWQPFCKIGATSFVNVGAFIFPICASTHLPQETASNRARRLRTIPVWLP